MGSSSEELTQEVQRARADLASTLEAVGDRIAPKKVVARAKDDVAERVETVRERVSPARMFERRTESLRLGIRDVQESLMATLGRSDDMVRENELEEARLPRVTGAVRGQSRRLTAHADDVAGTVADRAQRAPGTLRDKAEGNPLVAGLAAFGGGVLMASLLAPSDRERKVAQQIKVERPAREGPGAPPWPWCRRRVATGGRGQHRAGQAAGQRRRQTGQAASQSLDRASQRPGQGCSRSGEEPDQGGVEPGQGRASGDRPRRRQGPGSRRLRLARHRFDEPNQEQERTPPPLHPFIRQEP